MLSLSISILWLSLTKEERHHFHPLPRFSLLNSNSLPLLYNTLSPSCVLLPEWLTMGKKGSWATAIAKPGWYRRRSTTTKVSSMTRSLLPPPYTRLNHRYACLSMHEEHKGEWKTQRERESEIERERGAEPCMHSFKGIRKSSLSELPLHHHAFYPSLPSSFFPSSPSPSPSYGVTGHR